jgi:hypothetical protein
MQFLRFSFLVLFAFVFFGAFWRVEATSFDLIPPAGPLVRGQNVSFTITINTQGQSLTTAQVGLNYEVSKLQYVSTVAGNAMTGVSVDTTTYGTGSMLITGTNPGGFNGAGNFAIVTFTIIDTQQGGSTQLCSLWTPPNSGGSMPVPTTVQSYGTQTSNPQYYAPGSGASATQTKTSSKTLPKSGFDFARSSYLVLILGTFTLAGVSVIAARARG